MASTLLEIVGIGVQPYSARGLTQTLALIDAATSVRRTINGVMHDLSDPSTRKYKSNISCGDQRAPAVDGVWPGMIVTVRCVTELSYEEGSSSESNGLGSPGRNAVAGSTYVEEGFVFYRPELVMMVISHQQSHDEYGNVVSWQMDLEEV